MKEYNLSMENYDSYFKDLTDDTVVNLISQKLQSAPNRLERRKILKSLSNTKKIAAYTQEKITSDANKQLCDRSNDSFGYIMSMFGIILHDKYGWEDEKIEEAFTEMSNRLSGTWSDGKSVSDVANELFEKTGIQLIVR